MGFPQEIRLTPEEEAALDEAVEEAVAGAQATQPIAITDEYVAELEQAAKAWDDPAVQRMVREMERRRKEIQQQ